jgi:hypothetical protein
MTAMRKITRPALLALLLLALLLGLTAFPARAGDDVEQRALDRAHAFLSTARRGTDILSFVHFGAKYKGHAFKEWVSVTQDGRKVPGHFALLYEYAWEDDGLTTVAFLCDASGGVYDVQVVRTNAIFSQPYVLANGTIKVLGNLLIEAFKDNMKPEERQFVQKLIDDADAKGMLVWSLKFQQSLGR